MDLVTGGPLPSDLWFGVVCMLWLRLLLGRELPVDLILFTRLQDPLILSCPTAVSGKLRADLICQKKTNQRRPTGLLPNISTYLLLEFKSVIVFRVTDFVSLQSAKEVQIRLV